MLALAQEAERLHRAVGHGGGLGVAQGRRQGRHDAAGAASGADELCVGAKTDPGGAVDPVAGREAGHAVADGLDLPGELLAEDAHPGLEDAERQAHGEPDPRRELEPADLAVRPGGGRGVDAHEHFAGLGARRLDLLKPEDVRAAVGRADDRLHGYLAVTRVACALRGHSDASWGVLLVHRAGGSDWASRRAVARRAQRGWRGAVRGGTAPRSGGGEVRRGGPAAERPEPLGRDRRCGQSAWAI